MKRAGFGLVMAFAFGSTAASETVTREAADAIVRTGEIIASSTVLQPAPSFILLVRKQGQLFSCTVNIESTFNGDQMTKVNKCVGETNNY